MSQAIEMKSVFYRYPNGFEALKNINITVEKNDFLAIIGQNGAGKSTLLKNITGLLKPTQGDILINGHNTKSVSIAKLSTELGFVLQNPDRQLFADTVYDEIAFGPKNLKLEEAEIQTRVEEAMNLTGLTEAAKRFPPALSAGERAKVVIASVAAMRPDIIVLDEPTTGQDHRGCYQIMDIARKFQALGHTIIMVTHHMALVAEYARRTIVFCQGEVLLDDTTQNVFGQPELLKKSYVIPPQITMLGLDMQKKLETEQVFLNVDALAERVVQCAKSAQGV